jgi:hypothetical protein
MAHPYNRNPADGRTPLSPVATEAARPDPPVPTDAICNPLPQHLSLHQGMDFESGRHQKAAEPQQHHIP